MGNTVSHIDSDCNANINAANLNNIQNHLSTTESCYQERYCGLVNFGNTCYSNSVLQALYFCKPFRDKILEYKHSYKNRRHYKETLLTCLADLFYSIATRKKKLGSIAPKKFIARLRKEKVEFDNYNQQDAHEFLNFLINHINEAIQAERRCQQHDESAVNGGLTNGKGPTNLHSHHSHNHNNHLHHQRGQNTPSNISSDNYSISTSSSTTTSTSGVVSASSDPTWVHEIFQGILTSETRCLNCEKISCKDEDFFDLQIDVEQNTSITYCLKSFSDTETLRNENKFKCDNCRSYQEAQKKMRVKKLPLILALHLKRFKYIDQFNKHTKISHRVVFPLELRLFNTSDDAVNPDRLYDLISVVIHCGSGPNRGHYISIVKGATGWLLFDDETYEAVDVSTIEEFFGSTSDNQKTSETGYILFYQSRDRNF